MWRDVVIKNLNNKSKRIEKVKRHLQNVSIRFPSRNLHDGCQLNGKQKKRLYTAPLIKKIVPLNFIE